MVAARLRALGAALAVLALPASGVLAQGPDPGSPAAEAVAAEAAAPPAVEGGPAGIAARVQADIEKEASELERVRRELEKARQERQNIAARETRILGQLNSLDSEVALKQRLLSGLSRKEERLAADLERTRAKLVREQQRLDEQREVLRRRLRNIYKYGEKPGLQVLLGADSAVDLVKRFDYLLLVAAQDRRLVEDIRESVRAVHEAEEEAARKQGEVRAIRLESEEEKASLQAKREERGQLLAGVRKEKKSREQLIAELEHAEKQVQQLISELEEKAKLALEGGLPPEGTGFEQMRGRLP